MSQNLVLNNYNISIVLNSKLGKLRDNLESEFLFIEEWVNSLVNQTKPESFIRKKRCEICNSKEDYFEGHHIAGRKHDFRQITVCKTCHDILSAKQKLRPNNWLKYNQTQTIREAFFFYGLYDILILKSQKTGNLLYEEYANLIIPDIEKRLC